MSVNPGTYSRRIDILKFNYSFEGSLVKRCDHVKDLGVLIDSSFQFSHNIGQICTRAYRGLAQVVLTANHGLSLGSEVVLYRQLIDYTSIIWSPHLPRDLADYTRCSDYLEGF